MTTPHDDIARKELGQRTDAELEALFGDIYAGWDRGVNLMQERFGNGDTRFTETPMTPLELAARYVASEIGANIYEIAGRAAFAPIIVFSQIQARIGPVFEEVATTIDSLLKERDELRAYADELFRENGIVRDMLLNPNPDQEPDNVRLHREKCDAIDRALRAEQERDALQARVKELEARCSDQTRMIQNDHDLRRADISRIQRLQQERDKAYERAAKECSDYARWAEQQISEDDPPESSKSQLFATISNTADDCAEKVRDLIRRLAGPEKEGK